MSRWLIALPILALAGCVQPPPGPNPFLQAQIGKPELQLVHDLGVPSRSYETDGHKFLAYESSTQWADYWGPGWGPGWRHWGGWGGPEEIVTNKCETTFDLVDDRVIGYQQHGTGC